MLEPVWVAEPTQAPTIYYSLLDRGFFEAYDARTGTPVYGRQRIRVGASFTSSPWAYYDKIFALSEHGDT